MKRILLKISGEAFSGATGSLDILAAKQIADMIQKISHTGRSVAVVVGWGNIYRGSKLIEAGFSPTDSHNMSMLSTVFNAVTLRNILRMHAVDAVVLDALHIGFLERYTSEAGKKYLEEGKIVILSSGTGTPYFSTDTAAVLRALELECEAVIKLTKVDGVYTQDPIQYPDATHLPEISYDDFISQNLKVFDQTGVILARDAKLPIYIMKLDTPTELLELLDGEKRGSKIF